MGYRITYDKNTVKILTVKKRRSRLPLKPICAAVILIISLCLLSNSKVRSYLLPGDPKVTERAFLNLVSDLKEGDGVSDAVTAFCREIIENA